MTKVRVLVFSCLLLVTPAGTQAQAPDTTTRLRLNGFVDTYYAYDFTRPADGDRRFTTQPARHDEMNVNLAWLGLTVERPRSRARIALQAGTSVQANYAGEPRNGTVSGPELARIIQEGSVGARLSRTVWLDAGIYASYIGLEGWTSGDNPTYTRSLVADYSPYYLSGARVTWTASPRVTAQLHVMNGWQIISENNRGKAVGSRVDVAVSPAVTVSYANFVGTEPQVGRSGAMRLFNQLMARGQLAGGTQWQGQVDVGQQDGQHWSGLVAIVRQPLTSRIALSGRLERFNDRSQVIITTGHSDGFIGTGGSVGMDVALESGVRWRSEVRAIRTTADLFPDGITARPVDFNRLLVTSLSVAF